MIYGINPALSGLAAAGKRLEVASNNVANINSTRTQTNGVSTVQPYQPQEVVQTSLDTGGVSTQVRASNAAAEKVFAPDHPDANEEGFVTLPGVSLEEQIIQSKVATYDYRANLRSIDTHDKMLDHLLDILS
jgi:flagellar basal-body rod protein FlgC